MKISFEKAVGIMDGIAFALCCVLYALHYFNVCPCVKWLVVMMLVCLHGHL